MIFSMKTLRTPVEDDTKKIECTHEGKHTKLNNFYLTNFYLL